MKPLHVAILVAVSAVAGAVVMKWQIGRNAIPVKMAAATTPAAQLTPARSQPAEPALPSLVVDEPVEPPHPARKPRRSEPVAMARNIARSRSIPRNNPQPPDIPTN